VSETEASNIVPGVIVALLVVALGLGPARRGRYRSEVRRKPRPWDRAEPRA